MRLPRTPYHESIVINFEVARSKKIYFRWKLWSAVKRTRMWNKILHGGFALKITSLFTAMIILITTYNIWCISVSFSSLVVCILSIHSSTSSRRDLPVSCRNRWVLLASRHSASIFACALTSRRPAPFPAWRASTSTAFSSPPHLGSLKDCACRCRSAVDPVSRPSSAYRETGAIAEIGSAFS